MNSVFHFAPFTHNLLERLWVKGFLEKIEKINFNLFYFMGVDKVRANLSRQSLKDLSNGLNSEKRIFNKLIDHFEEIAILLRHELSTELNKDDIDYLKSLNKLIIEEKKIIVAIEQEISSREVFIS